MAKRMDSTFKVRSLGCDLENPLKYLDYVIKKQEDRTCWMNIHKKVKTSTVK